MIVTVAEPKSNCARIYSADVIASPTQFEKFAPGIASLQSASSALTPRAFFASVAPDKWEPRVVAVRCGSDLAGLVYFKERKVFGIPVGLLYADGVLGRCIIANDADSLHLIQAAIQACFASRRVTGIRFAVRRDGQEHRAIMEALQALPVDATSSHVQNHVFVPLPFTYEAFLNDLGPRTRRNFRYYRRRAEAAGHRYVNQLSPAELRDAAAGLITAGGVGADRDGQKRALQMIEAVDRPMTVGLRDITGRWLSVLAGWYGAADATVIYQLNDDRSHSRESLSVVLRGYLIEKLIESGRRNLFFWGGIGGALAPYAHPVPTISIYVDSRSAVWRTVRRAASLGLGMPEPFGSMMAWITPGQKDRSA